MDKLVRDEFKVHMLNDLGISRAKELAVKFSELMTFVEVSGPNPSRELSLAKTKLEEACFFAKRAMAQNPVNQKEPV